MHMKMHMLVPTELNGKGDPTKLGEVAKNQRRYKTKIRRAREKPGPRMAANSGHQEVQTRERSR